MAISDRHDDSDLKLLLKPSEAAKALGISERKLWGMTKAGEIPSIKLDRSVRYSVDSLREWIRTKEHSQPQTAI